MIQAVGKLDSLLGNRFTTELLSENFCIWRKRDRWTPQDDGLIEPHSPDVLPEIEEAIELAFGNGEPRMSSLSDGRLIWVQRIEGGGAKAAAVRFIRPDSAELIDLINRTSSLAWEREQSLRQTENIMRRQEKQLSAFAAQVSEDLEELTWLRQLANHLELSESGNSTEQIVAKILPGLCELVGAYSLIFLRDQVSDARNSSGPPMWQTGRMQVPFDVCQQIVFELSGRRNGSPVVVNNWKARLQTNDFCGIRSCILVPVASETTNLGWLIAINKDTMGGGRFRSTSQLQRSHELSETEFGTFEASLMSATAIIIAAHARNCGLLQEKELLLRGVIRSLINAIDAKDSYTCGHSDRVAELSRMIARSMQLSPMECDQIYMAGLLHDVGKIGVPDGVLQKQGRLTEEEFAQIKQHPVIGYEILKHIENFRYVLPGVLHHHEAMNGSGYPHGLRGEGIPLEARILAVADAYDAMTTDRTYRRGMPTEQAEQILKDGAGTQWDPACVAAFFRSIHGARLMSSQQLGTPRKKPFAT